MKRTIAILFAVASLCLAEVKTYSITVHEPSMVGSSQLEPGSYKVTVDGDKATFSNRTTKVEAAVKVETAEKKYDYTSIKIKSEGSSKKIHRIEFRGSRVAIDIN